MKLPRLALTAGEPAGIGPDLCIQIAQRAQRAELVVIADPQLLAERAAQLRLPLQVRTIDLAAAPAPHHPGTLAVLPVTLVRPAHSGVLDAANGRYVLQTLQQAIDACNSGRCAALVTAPVHKGIINEAGIPFTGHTEFLAAQCGNVPVVMMLATPGLRVALVTTHLPLQQVAAAITADSVEGTLRIVDDELRRRFGIATPRIAVCGLNPHAGEDGHLGREELDIIIPVLQRLRHQGLQLTGPLPADTAFIPKYLQTHDVFVAMYHDQGLPVLKYAGFGNAINVTLGLPFVRTSVDHGTALELAGRGGADATSLQRAIDTALAMCTQQQATS
ncbi:MAG: 4-hydroxythreonine-4-phosphate dehydrogenase PdxA [Gammaproteobacteria bacterium]|nr:4-hydroxythreonine-4-phosphate dehydrogenase PdxA [Gammaproteobacteria bacterium]